MANITNKIFVDKMGGRPASEFIGQQGDLFYDPAEGQLRLSDGITPGGTQLNAATTAVAYRGFYASYGSFYGNDPSVNQIIISKNQGMKVSYDTSDTDNDDLHAIGLNGSNTLFVLNLYGSREQKGLDAPTIARFLKGFIDTIVFDGNDELTDIADLQSAFYTYIDSVIEQHLPQDSLFPSFQFFNQNWFSNVIVSSGVNGTQSANIGVYADGQDNFNYKLDGVNSQGTGFTQGQVIVIPGTEIGLESPANDMTITIDSVDGNGSIVGLSIAGVGIIGWPEFGIDDGGNDQYDYGNMLNTNLQTLIPYANGFRVYQSPAVGGGDYVVMYQSSVFAFLVTNANVTDFYFSGNMGADGNGDKVESSLFGYESQQNTEAVDNFNNTIAVDSSSQLVNVPYGQDHPIPNFSGMVLINDHYDGSVECWLCGGNNTALVSSTHENPGTMNINGMFAGYVWNNSSNKNGPFTFTVIKTRYEA